MISLCFNLVKAIQGGIFSVATSYSKRDKETLGG